MLEAVHRELAGGGNVYILHHAADADAVGAAFALQEAFGGDVVAPAGVSGVGQRLVEALGLSVDDGSAGLEGRRPVVVDASSRVQLGPLSDVEAPVVVDHHAAHDDWGPGAVEAVLDRTSACEVALAVLDAAGHVPSRQAAFGLLVGVVADTAHFRFADSHTFEAAGRLLDACGRTMEAVAAVLDGDAAPEDARALRTARLKAARRMDLEKREGLVLAWTTVGAFGSAAAAGIVRLGADGALVAQRREGRAHVSARAGPGLVDAGVHLGAVCRAAARALGPPAGGGGHAASAGLNAPVAPEVALDAACRALRDAVDGSVSPP